MKTYWCRLFFPNGVPSSKRLDLFDTGAGYACFMIQATNKDDIFDMTEKLFSETGYTVDGLKESACKIYRDFAGPKTRFPMSEDYLDEEIDTTETVLARRK